MYFIYFTCFHYAIFKEHFKFSYFEKFDRLVSQN